MAELELEDNEAVNEQIISFGKPKEREKELMLYLIDRDCQAIKKFKVRETLKMLLTRQTNAISFGSTCEICKKKIGVILKWESE